MIEKALIIDGYTDEPAGLGVPPYLGTYPRYAYGILSLHKVRTNYITIDEFRKIRGKIDLNKYDAVICICGFHTPGKYLNAEPATLREFASILYKYDGIKILGGPAATKYGSSQIGGRIEDETKYKKFFDVVIEGDIDAVLNDLLTEKSIEKIDTKRYRSSYEELKDIAIRGAKLVKQHPKYPNIIVEVETYRGCSRVLSGGCSFCTEPRRFGSPKFRNEEDIVKEIHALWNEGIKYFRIGRQPCIFSYKAVDSEKEEVPTPNVKAIEKLFKGIRNVSDPKVLHVDNANPAVIARHEEESKEVAKILVKYCTSGNVAAFGVESFDEKVIKVNNLLTTPEDVLKAVEIINKIGGHRGESGLPYLLPGINLLFGLKGERKETFQINFEYLKKIYDMGFMLRRINIRQVVPFFGTEITIKDIKKAEKRKKLFLWFKEKVREEIDNRMLKRVAPKGVILRDVLVEVKEKDGLYFGRQFGSYPLLIGILEKNLEVGTFVDVKVVDYGRRSITGVVVKNNK
ncbi:Radical SAM domain protein [Methanocaldococcus vulcanius M7]|uniref:Radical SAM domain protein n=1 Tax=Methanocaldococcus vulcanius (strain ATCC 700851 / DSM 12094 / M7) TaxID=579137 RepID=C9RDK1_METVM|nr:radical SAM protein [Methanocaldococcus vulcanius]ACX73380.1 Radical SAM domain protein [Methanocaldococcus vulcanius M7]